MKMTVEELRKLIAEYRERLPKAEGTAMVLFIMGEIEEMERQLAEFQASLLPHCGQDSGLRPEARSD